jgi:hypothetical protein
MSGQSRLLIFSQAALIRLKICFLVSFLLVCVLSNCRRMAFCFAQVEVAVAHSGIGSAIGVAGVICGKNNIGIEARIIIAKVIPKFLDFFIIVSFCFVENHGQPLAISAVS